ncbi:MAG: hypothetical protein GF401_15345 [Chitinivibrionales bacterium]|nr:hypothetical protein [Chitinivibrionales bacterium]
MRKIAYMLRCSTLNYCALIACFSLAFLFFLCTSPSDPLEDPRNSNVMLFFPGKDSLVWDSSDTIRIGIILSLPEHLDSVIVRFDRRDDDTSISVPRRGRTTDTLYVDHTYATAGQKHVEVVAVFNKADYLNLTVDEMIMVYEPFHIDTGWTVRAYMPLVYDSFPHDFTLNAGSSDTLLIVPAQGNKRTVNA